MNVKNSDRRPLSVGRSILATGCALAAITILAAFQMRPVVSGATLRSANDPLVPSRLAAPKCEADNGGITLPPGFCAVVFADKLGSARHMVESADGDIYVAMQRGRGPATAPGVTVLRDTDGDGKADKQETFGTVGGGGIALSGNYLLVDARSAIVRYTLTKGQMVPTGAPDTIVSGLPTNGNHVSRDIAVDGKGNLFVNVGSATNVCQAGRDLAAKGADPCVELETRAGIWKFSDSKLGQVFSKETRFVTGLRNGVGLVWNKKEGALYSTQHGRDSFFQGFPQLYTQQKSAENPAEEIMQLNAGDDFGWPYCYYDIDLKKLVLAPEYGGDAKMQGRCTSKKGPLVAFPGHWAPNAMEFYYGTKFPAKYRDGAFVAFHGSWNRAPEPQAGYRVAFAPAKGGKYDGSYETFADGFPGGAADPAAGGTYRPTGLLSLRDGSLLVSDDKVGRIWKVIYTK